jgi:outer membrane protein assembly factor BamA
LWPRYYIPLLANDPVGAPAVGVAVVGEDAAALYSFSAQATYGLGLGRPATSLTFRFNDLYTPISIGLDYRTEVSDRFRRIEGEPELHVETVLRGSGALSIPLFRRRAASHSLGITYAQSLHFIETPPSSPPDAVAPVYPPPNNIGSITLDWGYAAIDVGRDSVSNERGFTSFVRLKHSNRLLLSDQTFTEVFIDARAFHPVPGLGGHVFGLYLSGGVGIGDPLFRTGFSIGGFQDRDITRDLLGGFRSAAGVLRGYPTQVAFGDAAALSTLEYRFPLLEMEKGIGTLPFFVERLHGAVFTDMGLVFGPVPEPTTTRASIGAELRLELTLAYYGLFIVRAGYARGVNEDGVDQPYVVMGFPY